jgi:hypothetical protein
MKRNYPFDTISSILDQDLIKQIAFHEAGHAAAIYLYNKLVIGLLLKQT